MKAGPVYVHVPVEYVADMRAVVIVEFWAMMAGSLPYGWQMQFVVFDRNNVNWFAAVHSSLETTEPRMEDPGLRDKNDNVHLPEVVWDAWAEEYAARPRMDEQ